MLLSSPKNFKWYAKIMAIIIHGKEVIIRKEEQQFKGYVTTYSANSKVQNMKPTRVSNGRAGKTNKHLSIPPSLHLPAL